MGLLINGCVWVGKGGGGAKAKEPKPPKICHAYSTIMKLGTVIPYLKKIQQIYESRNAFLEFSWHQHFSPEINKILLYQKLQIKTTF